MKVAIFSDLHLTPSKRSEHEHQFVNALRILRSQRTDELWLLGDIFDLMVGPFEFWTARHPEFFEELTAWHREGRSVVWIQGNHDFYLEDLLRKYGVIVSDDFIERRFGDRLIYLAHGDLVNPDDHAYLKWRKFTRSRGLRRILSLLPVALREKILLSVGKRLSDKSRAQSRELGRIQLEELFVQFARAKWKQGFWGVCLGHSHIETFVDEAPNFFVNLGSWVNYSPRYALWNSEGYKCPERYIIRDDGLSK